MKINNTPTFTLCLLTLLPAVCCAAVSTGSKETAPAADPSTLSSNNATEDKSRTPEKRPAGETHNLRCWQYGRLIFEEAIAAVPPELAASGISFRIKPDQKAALYLLDTNSGATCVVK